MVDAVVAEAMKKAAVAWVTVGDQPAVGLWCLPLGDALYVVSGPGEQSAPGLADAAGATVGLRGDHGGRITTFPAAVTRVVPDTDEWTEVAPQLAGKRLNASGTAADLAARWAAECVVSRLAPAGASLPPGDGSEAAPPRPTPAARTTRKPFRLHRVRRPRAD
jgi:hypothetical protein